MLGSACTSIPCRDEAAEIITSMIMTSRQRAIEPIEPIEPQSHRASLLPRRGNVSGAEPWATNNTSQSHLARLTFNA